MTLFICQSCNKSNEISKQKELKIQRSNTLSALSKLNSQDAIVAYLSLTVDETRDFWKEHVSKFVSTRTLNQNQISVVNAF